MRGQWVRLTSWHLVREVTKGNPLDAQVVFLCGKWKPRFRSVFLDEFPVGEKTCESCLRLQHKLG